MVELNFFGVVKMNETVQFIVYENRSKWVAVVVVIVGLWCWNNNGRSIFLKYDFLKKYLLLVSISLLILYIDAWIRYPRNSMLTTYGQGAVYLYSYLSILLIFLFEKQEGIEKVMRLLMIVSIISYTVTLIDCFAYYSIGNTIFLEEIITRDNKLYINVGSLINIVSLYAINQVVSGTKKCLKIEKLTVLLSLLYFLFTYQSRANLFAFVISSLMIICCGNVSMRRKILISILIFSVALAAIISGYVNQFFQSFSIEGSLGSSTYIRISGWKYYFSQFLKNPFTGIGFAGPTQYFSLIHGNFNYYYQGSYHNFYYSDCGFVGQLAKMGMFAIIIYVWPIVHFIKIAYYAVKNKNKSIAGMTVGYVVFLIITSASLIVLDYERVIAWPVIIALFEYFEIHNCSTILKHNDFLRKLQIN